MLTFFNNLHKTINTVEIVSSHEKILHFPFLFTRIDILKEFSNLQKPLCSLVSCIVDPLECKVFATFYSYVLTEVI